MYYAKLYLVASLLAFALSCFAPAKASYSTPHPDYKDIVND